jgi:hypothetical protein
MSEIVVKLEVKLVDNFINLNDQEEREWLEHHLRNEAILFLHDNEIGDTISKDVTVTNIEFLNGNSVPKAIQS